MKHFIAVLDDYSLLIVGLGIVILGIILLPKIIRYEARLRAKSQEIIRKKWELSSHFDREINESGKSFYRLFNHFPPIYTEDGTSYILPLGCEEAFRNFSAGSHLPQKGYQLAYERTEYIPYYSNGRKRKNPIMFVYFRPANGAKSNWQIFFVDNDYILCKHPIMGEIRLDKEPETKFKSGETITVEQTSVLTNGTYRISFHISKD